ncbi:MAG: hypothetical protein ACOH5I_21675 [Oligoflexus sp.]
MRRLWIFSIVKAFLLVLVLALMHLLLGPSGLWRQPLFWQMALVTWACFFVGFWFYQRFAFFWRQRHPLYPIAYAVTIISAYFFYTLGFFAKYPLLGILPLAPWHPWIFFLAGMAVIIMFGPTILKLNLLLAKKTLVRSGLGLLILAILAYPYFKQERAFDPRVHLLLRFDPPKASMDLQDYGIRANRWTNSGLCPKQEIELWQAMPGFVPFYWFISSAFSSQPLCVVIKDLNQEILDDHRWDQKALIIWSKPEWEKLIKLFPNFSLVLLQTGEDATIWRLYRNGGTENAGNEP